MIRFKNLTKRYESGKGIFDFSFEVEEGEVFGLIGPKESGKSTALRMLMGFEDSTKGRCAINGKDCAKDSLSLHKIMGYLPQHFSLPGDLTGKQFLRSMAQMRRIRNLERMFELALKLDVELDQKIGKMSRMDVKKVGLICAMMHNPQVLLLDQPFGYLDEKSRSVLVNLILEEKEKNRMVILTTDSVTGADLTCDRVALLDRGNVAYIGDMETLRENMYRDFMIQFGSSRTAMQFSKEEFEIRTMKDRSVVVTIQGEMGDLIKALSRYDVTGIEPVPMKLDEAFVHIYGGRVYA